MIDYSRQLAIIPPEELANAKPLSFYIPENEGELNDTGTARFVNTTTDTGTRVYQSLQQGQPELHYLNSNVPVQYGDLYTIYQGQVYPVSKTASGFFEKGRDLVTYQLGNLIQESPAPPPSPPSPQVTFTKVTDTTNGFYIDVMMSEYIRPRTINFDAKGLKPLTRVYFYFDGVNVDNQIVQTSPAYVASEGFKTDSSGSISGTFDIPFGKFFVGDRIFWVTDSSVGDITLQTTGAQTKYVAYGLELATTTLKTPSSEAVRPIDPLAQSFFVGSTNFPKGIFLSKVDLFFKSKDSYVPLTIQIRDTVNGYPSSTSVLSSIEVPAGSVNVSDDATSATTVEFPNLVYLPPGEYAIVIMANSVNYEAWVAQIGESNIGSDAIISQQPYVGSLFKSQNASTWTAEQTQDLKFKLYNCKFQAGTFNVDFTDWNSTDVNPLNQTTVSTKLSVKGATGVLFDTSSDVDYTNDTIKVSNHCYSSGSPVTYYAAPGSGSIGIGSTGFYINVINSDLIRLYSNENSAIFGGATGLVGLSNGSPVGYHQLYGGANVVYLETVKEQSIKIGSEIITADENPASGIPSTTKITSINIHDNSVVLDKLLTADIPAGTDILVSRKTEGGGPADLIMVPNAVFNPFTDNTVVHKFKAYDADGNIDANYTEITPNTNFSLDSEKYFAASGESFQKRVSVTLDEDSYVSPVINTTRQSVVSVGYRINDLVSDVLDSSITSSQEIITVEDGTEITPGEVIKIDSEEMLVRWKDSTNLYVVRGYNGTSSASHNDGATVTDVSELKDFGGNARARYITRKVTLASDCSYLRAYLSINKPAGTDVLVYYKVRSNSDSERFSSKNWIQMVQSTPKSNVVSASPDQYIEYTFVPSDETSYTDVSSGTRKIIYTSGSVTYQDFIDFALKIVLVSSDPVTIPVVSELRCIALE